MKYYIASCVFTEKHPTLSDKIQAYARRRGMSVVRCQLEIGRASCRERV